MAWYFLVALAGWGLAQLAASGRRLVAVFSSQPAGEAVASHPTRRWNAFDYILVTVLVGFSAVRYFVGTDYQTYLSLHQKIDLTDVVGSYASSPVEVGYTTLSIVVHALTDFPYAIFWATSILTVVPVYIAIKRSSLDLPFSVTIYMLLAFYVFPFNLIRQGIAVALLFLAHTFYEKNRALYFVLSALAGLFHYTAWLAAAIQWMFLRWRPTIRMTTYIVASILLAGLLFVVINAMNPAFVSSLLSAINPRYGDYFDRAGSGIGTYLIIATRLALLYLAFLLLRRSGDGLIGTWREYGAWFAFAALGICFLTIGTQAVNAGRIDYYFSIFLVLLIPNLLKGIQASEVRPKAVSFGRFIELATSPRNVKVSFAILGSLYYAMFIANFSDLLPYQAYLGQ